MRGELLRGVGPKRSAGGADRGRALLARSKHNWWRHGGDKTDTEFEKPLADGRNLLIIQHVKLERVKGIEPSYSAWKAAALPLSYTRLWPINYHARQAASTAMRRFGPETALFPRPHPPRPLTDADSMPIMMSPSTMKGGDPVSYTKRCHLAGIAR